MFRKITLTLLVFLLSNNILQAKCVVFSCNKSVSYAIGRYRDKTAHRLNDFKKTINEMIEMEKIDQKVELNRLNELQKLNIRYRLLLQDLMATNQKYKVKTLKKK